MLLFLGGIGLIELFVVLVIFALIGVGIFYLVRPLIRRLLKNQSPGTVNAVARLVTIILTPALFILIVYLLFSYLSDNDPYQPTNEDVARYYQMMDEDFDRRLKVGMSKPDVLQEFALEDTTQSEYEIDLSHPTAEETYILKLKFEKGKLVSRERVK